MAAVAVAVRPPPRGATLRRGAALVVALALLALAAALLAGSAAGARATARASRTHLAIAVAEGGARHVAATWPQLWERAGTTLAIGAVVIGDSVRSGGGAPAWTSSMSLRRMDARRWLVVAECTVGADSAPLARRRVALLLERALADTTAPARAPSLVRGWGMIDLH